MNENLRPVETTGQQRAAARLEAIWMANAVRYATIPADKVTRQQRRRPIHKGAKRLRAHVQTIATRGALVGLRERRLGTVHQGPGTLTMIGRSFKKPHGQANWRVRDLGDSVDLLGRGGLEVVMHTTKGLRVTRA